MDLFQGVGGKCGRPMKNFGRLLLGGSNAGKWSDHKKKIFFTNNSVEVVISIN